MNDLKKWLRLVETQNLSEVLSTEHFGKPTLSPREIAKKHHVPLTQVLSQLRKGIKIENEHTDDASIAEEIALDHINEIVDYYDRLTAMEKNAE